MTKHGDQRRKRCLSGSRCGTTKRVRQSKGVRKSGILGDFVYRYPQGLNSALGTMRWNQVLKFHTHGPLIRCDRHKEDGEMNLNV